MDTLSHPMGFLLFAMLILLSSSYFCIILQHFVLPNYLFALRCTPSLDLVLLTICLAVAGVCNVI